MPDRPGIATSLSRALADRSINVDMIVQNTSVHGTTDISFTVPKTDLDASVETAQGHADELGASGVTSDRDVFAGVPFIGVRDEKSHPGIAGHHVRDPGPAQEINIDMISTSTIRTSCMVRTADVERAVRCLHAAFALE